MTHRKRHDQEDAQQEALIAALDALRDADPVALGRTCYTAIRRVLRQARSLPPDPAAYRQWFRAACRHPDGRDYSRSQRALFAQQFNRVGQHWADQGLVETPLVVANYRRRPLGGVADARVHQALRPSELRRLEETFRRSLTEPAAATSPEAARGLAFCRLTFALIAEGGLAWPGAVATLADLPWQHLRPAGQGFIRFPRRGVWLRLYVPPWVQALALLLGTHLPRSRQFGEPVPEQLIVPPGEPAADPDPVHQRRLRQVHTRFNAWLRDLCHQAGVPVITLATLQQAARPRLAATCGNVLAAAILGQTVYAPVPDGQADVFATYREPFALPATPSAPLPVARVARASRPPLAPADRGDYHLEGLITTLQETLHPLIAEPAASRAAVAVALERLAREWLGVAESELSLAVAAARERVDGDTFNLAVLAAWLAHLCRATHLRLRTLADYRSDGCMLARHCAGRRWDELDEEDVAAVAALELSVSERSRRLTVLSQVAEYLNESLGIATTLDRAAVRLHRHLRPVNLIGQPDVARLLAHVAAPERDARAQGRADEARQAHNVYLAVLLAYFWGLRRGEVPRLRLGDLVLDAQQPYVRVRNSKRGRSRVVWARHVPPAVLDALRAEWQRRSAVEGGDPGATFLEYEGSAEVAAEALGKAVNAAIRALGLTEEPDALPITCHTLRHAYANRLLVLGVPLLEIARSLGHGSTDTTTSSYLHAFDWLQQQRLAEVEAAQPHEGLTAAQIGVLLGIRRPAVLAALQKLPPGAVEDWRDGDRHVYSWATVVRLVADRLKIKE